MVRDIIRGANFDMSSSAALCDKPTCLRCLYLGRIHGIVALQNCHE